jgi:hypothetical protein
VPDGLVFPLEFTAPSAPGTYKWDIEPRTAADVTLTTLITGRITVSDDVTHEDDWPVAEE